MQSLYDKCEKFVINEKFKVVSDEVNYFFNSFKPQNAYHERILDRTTGNMIKLSVAGSCLGLSLALSLRRYMPNTFGEMSILRLVMEASFVFTGYTYFTKWATYNAYNSLYDIRRELVLTNDNEYLKFIIRKYMKYKHLFPQEHDVFRDILTKDEFDQWKAKNDFQLNLFANEQLEVKSNNNDIIDIIQSEQNEKKKNMEKK